MLQPPPRRVKPAVLLKDLQTHQTSKLLAREQQILEILEDIRLFSKQRSDLERQYGQGLLKLTNQLLLKKELFAFPKVRANSDAKKRTINSAWKHVLEVTEKLAWQRVKAAEIYASQVSEPSRILKERTAVVVKKGMERLSALHKELAQSTTDMAGTHKLHMNDEAAYRDACVKANEAEARLKKNQKGSIGVQGTLSKATAKVLSQRETCSAKAAQTRNGYLLDWVAANAHNYRYHFYELPDLLKMLDEGIFPKLCDMIGTLGKAELDVCTAVAQTHRNILDSASAVDGDYNQQCFIDDNEEFQNVLCFESDAISDSQTVTALCTDYGEAQRLDQETRKWAGKVAREVKNLRDLNKALTKLSTQTLPLSPSGDTAGPVSILSSQNLSRSTLNISSSGKEMKRGSIMATSENGDMDAVAVELLRTNIRKSEIGKAKAEARLELLRKAGIDVDSALALACSETALAGFTGGETDEQDSSSLHSSTGGGQRAIDDDAGSIDSAGRDGGDTYLTQAVGSSLSDSAYTAMSSSLCPYNVRALYSYEPCNSDELLVVKDEVLEVTDPGCGDGWAKARNAHGDVGFVPLNYVITLPDGDAADDILVHTSINVTVTNIVSEADKHVLGMPVPVAMSSIQNTVVMAAEASVQSDEVAMKSVMAAQDSVVATNNVTNDLNAFHRLSLSADVVDGLASSELVSPLALQEPQAMTSVMTKEMLSRDVMQDRSIWLRALFDYAASEEEELSFSEGQHIRLISRDDNGVDDGYWQGQLADGRTGVFPSCVVEELEHVASESIDNFYSLDENSR